PFACPFGIGPRIDIADLNDWVISLVVDAASRPLWLPPIGTGHVLPPLPVLREIDRPGGAHEHHGSRDEYILRRSWNARRKLSTNGLPVGLPLRGRHIPCGFDEFSELIVGDMRYIHPEAAHLDLMSGTLVGLSQRTIAS